MAVVDQYCRVHGLEGLRVADTSVMPDVAMIYDSFTYTVIVTLAQDWGKCGLSHPIFFCPVED